MKLKYLVAAAAVTVSGSAFAGVTGNVGVFSEYVYRGIPQADGGAPAVQGGLDYAHDSGFYVGTWASSLDGGMTGSTGSYEIDFYGGFAGEVSGFKYDLGATYYAYPKDKESAGDTDIDTTEFYIKGGYGPFKLSYFYSDDWFASNESAQYINGALSFPLSDSLNLDLSVGYSFGDYYDAAGDEITDYSVSLTKSVTENLAASFAVVGSDVDGDDTPRFILGAKYSFDL